MAAKLKAEQEAKEKAERELEIEIQGCTPATLQTIKAYLQSVGKAKLTDITKDQAEHLRKQIQPKCHKGHVIKGCHATGT